MPCNNCDGLLKVAKEIISNGSIKLKDAFKLCCPNVKYTSFQARRKLLQMPLAVMPVGTLEEETFCLYLLEKQGPASLSITHCLINEVVKKKKKVNRGVELTKDEWKKLLDLTESESERQRLSYAVVKATGLSNSKAKSCLGLSDMGNRRKKVEEAMEEANAIKNAIDNIAKIKDQALLQEFGIELTSDSDGMNDESESETDSDGDSALSAEYESGESSVKTRKSVNEKQPSLQEGGTDSDMPHEFQLSDFVNEGESYKHVDTEASVYMNSHQLLDILKQSDLNWFYFVRVLKETLNITKEALTQLLLDFSGQLSFLGLTDQEEKAIELSRQAYLNEERMRETMEDGTNEIMSESESSESEVWAMGVQSPLDERGKLLIKKKRAALRRQHTSKLKKALVEKRYLKRRRSKRVGRIIAECPNIGKEIENFVKECGAGADAWRRTGVITFDGNRKLKKKATFKRIQEHLIEKYGKHISYGSVVQLCCARNKRRMSAARYRGIANVISKRARKGFSLKYNPDQHWSSSFYACLDKLQYKDGTNIINIGRDDQAGFRLDTMATQKLHATLCVKGKEHLNTRTDFVNKYPSTLQTTSYNFASTESSGEICAGIVKATGLFQKNAAQHFSDLEMIENKEEVIPAFINPLTGARKEVECVRVDGSTDEGPSRIEVQFWWTVRHMTTRNRMLLITSRNSGASYRNRVELQNGCLALAHANLFIPSTLNGSCLNSSGNVDHKVLHKNLNSAIDVYISRVDKAPCAGTVIHLYKGSDSSALQKNVDLLKTFLKGSKAAKDRLAKDHQVEFEYFKQVWDLHERHLRRDVPQKYIFCLACCYQPDCCHPLCKEGPPSEEQTWYPGGPPLSFLPLPVADVNRSFGATNCKDCEGICSGHYLKFEELLKHKSTKDGTTCSETPSQVIAKEFKKLQSVPEGNTLLDIAKKVLLPTEETQMWFQHLLNVGENRKKGAQKAVQTRKANKKQPQDLDQEGNNKTSESELCTTCHSEEPSDNQEKDIDWIMCDSCGDWHHMICVGLYEEAPEHWQCFTCIESWEFMS